MSRIKITRPEAKKLVMLIKNGSLESGILVMLSLATTLVLRRKEKKRGKNHFNKHF